MEFNVDRKEKLIEYFEELRQKLSKPIFILKDESVFYLNQKSTAYNGFTNNIFNQTRNIIFDSISISNISFDYELLIDDNFELLNMNEFFLILLKDLISDVKKAKSICELEILYSRLIIDTHKIYNICY